MVADDTGGPLINRVTGIRRQISKSLGFVVPDADAVSRLSLVIIKDYLCPDEMFDVVCQLCVHNEGGLR